MPKQQKHEPTALRYRGHGFVVGVPARDLTAEEAAEHDAAGLIASGLYEADPTPPAPSPSGEPASAPETA